MWQATQADLCRSDGGMGDIDRGIGERQNRATIRVLIGALSQRVSRRFIADVVLGATLALTMQPSTRSQYPPYFIRPRPQLVPTTSTLVAMKENRRSVARLSCRRRARRACGRSLPRHADIVHIAIATGAREEELLKATRGQVDHENRQMTLIG